MFDKESKLRARLTAESLVFSPNGKKRRALGPAGITVSDAAKRVAGLRPVMFPIRSRLLQRA